MTIGFITTKINFRGAGGSVPDLDCKVRSMQELGADVFVVTLFSELNALPTLPYPVYERRVKAEEKTWFATQREVFMALREYEKNADVFHVEGHFVYGAAFYRALGGKPIVVFYNREMIAWESGRSLRARLRRAVEKILCRLLVPSADHHIFTTPFLAEMYFDFGLRLRPGQHSILVDFLDPTEMKTAVAGITPGGDPAALLVFASGRMIAQKGFHILVEAFALMDETTRAHARLVIGGDGPERERVMRLAQERNVSEHIFFPGWMKKEEFWQMLARCDIFVLPRWRIEQPSVVVMEALALGIPVVAPGGGGVEWMAGDAVSTFMDSDPESLSLVLTKLIDSKKARDRLSSAAHTRWHSLDHHVRAKELFHIFQKLTKRI